MWKKSSLHCWKGCAGIPGLTCNLNFLRSKPLKITHPAWTVPQLPKCSWVLRIWPPQQLGDWQEQAQKSPPQMVEVMAEGLLFARLEPRLGYLWFLHLLLSVFRLGLVQTSTTRENNFRNSKCRLGDLLGGIIQCLEHFNAYCMSESANHFNAKLSFPFISLSLPKRKEVKDYRRVSHGSKRFDPADSKWKLLCW